MATIEKSYYVVIPGVVSDSNMTPPEVKKLKLVGQHNALSHFIYLFSNGDTYKDSAVELYEEEKEAYMNLNPYISRYNSDIDELVSNLNTKIKHLIGLKRSLV